MGVLSSYNYQMVGHNASGFDNYKILNSLLSTYNSLEVNTTSRGLIKLSFKAVSVIGNDVETPIHKNFVCSNCLVSGLLRAIQNEYNIQL